MASERRAFQDEVAQVEQWWKVCLLCSFFLLPFTDWFPVVARSVLQEPRWWKTTRPYTAAEVVAKRGTLPISYPSNVLGKKLWRILSERYQNGTPSHTYGA